MAIASLQRWVYTTTVVVICGFLHLVVQTSITHTLSVKVMSTHSTLCPTREAAEPV